MSVANSQKEIMCRSLVELAAQLEVSIRKAAQEGESLYEVEKDTFAGGKLSRASTGRS